MMNGRDHDTGRDVGHEANRDAGHEASRDADRNANCDADRRASRDIDRGDRSPSAQRGDLVRGTDRDGPIHDGSLRDGPIHDDPARDGPIHDDPTRDGPILDGFIHDANHSVLSLVTTGHGIGRGDHDQCTHLPKDVHSLNEDGETDYPVRIRSHMSRNRHHTDQSLDFHKVSDAPRDYLDDLADHANQANLSYF